MREVGIVGPGHKWAGAEVCYEDSTRQWFVNGILVDSPSEAAALYPHIIAGQGIVSPVPTLASKYADEDNRGRRFRRRTWVTTLVIVPLLLCCWGGISGGSLVFSELREYSLRNYNLYGSAEVTGDKQQTYVLSCANRFSGLVIPRDFSIDKKAPAGLDGVLGYYSEDNRTIHIIDQSSENLPMKDYFSYVVKHEYGHALLADYMDSQYEGSMALVMYKRIKVLTPSMMKESDIQALPEDLRPAAREFMENPTRLGKYASTAFAEHMAESYARYVVGLYTPPAAKKFYQDLESKY